MSQRAELLDLERRKLSLLRNKVKEQEARIQTLEGMEDDPFDALLEQELAANTTAQRAINTIQTANATSVQTPAQVAESADVHTYAQSGQVSAASEPAFAWQRKPRRMPDKWIRLLTFIGKEGKDYEQVTAFIDDNDLSLTHGAARTQLMNYRRDFAFVENPRKGFYVATERALEFIAKQQATKADSSSEDEL